MRATDARYVVRVGDVEVPTAPLDLNRPFAKPEDDPIRRIRERPERAALGRFAPLVEITIREPSTRVEVELTNKADGMVIADSLRLERIPE